MRRCQGLWFALVVCAGCARTDGASPSASSDEAPARVASTGLATLAGSLRPDAIPQNDRGRLEAGRRLEGMTVTFARGGSRQERQQLLRDLADPGSPSYRQWLSPEQYAARFGASDADVARVTAWLQAAGFDVQGPNRTHTSVAFGGTVGQLEAAFRTEMHAFDVGGERHFALAIAPSVPAELADLVSGLRGVHDFKPKASPSLAVPEYKLSGKLAIAPADWATIYDVAPLYTRGTPIDGTGQTVAIAGQSKILASDILAFRKQFGLSATGPTMTLVPNSGQPYIPDVGNQTESSLDVEWSGAIAKNATIDFVFTGDSPNYSVYDAALYAIDQKLAPVVSFSFGGCELGFSPSEVDYLGAMGEVAEMMGITWVVASGDAAAAGCDEGQPAATHGLSPSFPADMPSVTAVGGTILGGKGWNAQDQATEYTGESGWNDTVISKGILGGGGGVSSVFPKPYWQVGTTMNDKGRDVPDIAFAAAVYEVPYAVLVNGTVEGVGGTSCAAPSFAGVLGLVNQATAAGGLGNFNPVLYGVAQSDPTAFHDVTTGGNVVPCTTGSPDCKGGQLGYYAGKGYDLVTGFGSLDTAKFLDDVAALVPTSTSLTAMASGTTEGSPLTLNATVSSTGTSKSIGGKVSFVFETLDKMGQLDIGASLGDVDVTPNKTGGKEGATAQLVTTAPPGLTGTSTIVAVYGGDTSYLGSWSKAVQVKATGTLTVSPASASVKSGQSVQFTASGGKSPVSWSFYSGTTHATIDATGKVTAGCGKGGQDVIIALDADNAQATATVTIVDTGCDAGSPGDDGGSVGVDASGPVDSGGDGFVATFDASTPMEDAGTPAPDAAVDASDGGSGGGGGSSGCHCDVAGSAGGGAPASGAALVGLGLLVSRRRRGRRAA